MLAILHIFELTSGDRPVLHTNTVIYGSNHKLISYKVVLSRSATGVDTPRQKSKLTSMNIRATVGSIIQHTNHA